MATSMEDQSSEVIPHHRKTFGDLARSFTANRTNLDRIDIADPLRGVSNADIRDDMQQLFPISQSSQINQEEWDNAIILAKLGSRPPPLGRFTQEELDSLKAEREQVFFQSGILPVILTVALAAFLQGHVQSSINAGSLFESLLEVHSSDNDTQIGTRRKDWEIGGMNASPYLTAAIVGAPISLPTNYYIGRRGALIVSAMLIIASSVASAFCHNWAQLLGVRIIGGVGMGIKAVSAPILAAETATGYWRGSILITWQVACGIMIGFVVNLVIAKATNVLFLKQDGIEPDNGDHYLALQLILGAPLVASVALLISVYFCYESSRFYMREESPNFDPNQALKILLRIRKSKLQALRDIILIRWSEKLKRRSEPNGSISGSSSPEQGLTYASQLRVVLRLSLNQYRTLFKTPRLRNAVWSTSTVALAQQLCGINVFAFYSSKSVLLYGQKLKKLMLFLDVVFNGTDSTIDKPMFYSFGFGAINFLFCLPAMRTIDTFGRRTWLLATLPIMSLLLAGAAGAFPADDSNVVSPRVAAGISLILIFVAVYSPGLGPIPFTLASESFPLSHREAGASAAIATNLFFAGILTIIIPAMKQAFKTPGLLGFFAGMNIIALILVFFIVEETRMFSLEELDEVYKQPKSNFAKYQLSEILPYFVKRYLLFQSSAKQPPSYDEWIARKESTPLGDIDATP
ncbi:unnamed protein product [Clonostachys rosea]|uniref:Major facilitator superfamily (MFS) profile domain-containing protein n=1 Tax=Bionectria ochroleuca TaxID=29856 RepID=A0ABY6U4Y4_BIOOC|nr:unnamed protein product [Clonostachys rosea]